MTRIFTSRDLALQTVDSRLRVIEEALRDLFDRCFDLRRFGASENFIDSLGFGPAERDRLAAAVHKEFPFFPSDKVAQASSLDRLTYLIASYIGVLDEPL